MSQVLQSPMDNRMGGIKRQATWDALPDIDFFSIPVDDFFETYVSELGAQATPQAVPSPVPATNGALDGHLDPVLEHFPHSGTHQMNGLVTPAEAAALPPEFQQGAGGIIPPYAPGAEEGMPPLPTEPAQLPALGNIITSGFEAQQGVQRRSGSGSHSQGSGNYGNLQLNHSPHGSGSHEHMSADDSPEDDGGGRSARAKKGSAAAANTKTKRNARQQDQNKQAQQRYRERRKAKFAEMEQALAVLHAQVEQLQGVQSHNAHLQGHAAELEGKLNKREAEVERLRSALHEAGVDTQTLMGSDPGFIRPQPKADYKPFKPSECVQMRAERERQRDEEIRALQADMGANVEELRALVEAHDLRHCDPSGAGVPPEVVARVRALVERGCGLCQNAMRAEGIKVLALMSCDVARMGTISCHVEAAKWDRILDVLRVTSGQAEALLDMRKKHLRNLHALYEDRQRLNLQAMSLMLPKNIPRRDQQLPNAETLESRMDCMRITNSYGQCANSAVQLDHILDDIKCNLRKEQRTVMEQSWYTMHKVLTPIQSGLFVVEVFPGHCDCLALSNALAKRMGVTNSGAQQGSCSSDDKSETCSLGITGN